jgi:sugar lactone lactonase YvrE
MEDMLLSIENCGLNLFPVCTGPASAWLKRICCHYFSNLIAQMLRFIHFFCKFSLVFLPLAGCRNAVLPGTVTTLAGSGLMGASNGAGDKASFSNPMGIAVDRHGNVYVADTRNNLIRKISPDGHVTTLAGSGAAGSEDGFGKAASFFGPAGITVDKSGNVYVADTHNCMIRKIDPEGVVTTLAGRRGSRISGSDEVPFDNPAGIAVDEKGIVYVADWANNLIRIVDTGGRVKNLSGTGRPGLKDDSVTTASFFLPWGLAIDSFHNVFISDSYNNLIRKIRPGGMVSTIAGKKNKGSADGKGEEAQFFHPAGIALDENGSLYVADAGNNVIRKITPDGIVSTLAGSGKRGSIDGVGLAASFFRPMGLALDHAGFLYVADYQNNRIRKIKL